MRPQILMRSWPGNLARRLKATGWMLAALTATAGSVAAAPVFFEAGGSAAPASIQSTVDAFRAALGDPNNGNAPGPLASGHREINWDGGGPPVDANALGGTPFNVFLNTRGAQFITDGTGFVQAPPSGGPQSGLEGVFNNPTYGDTFGVFSPNRDFTPVGSTITQGLFFIPGTMGGTPAEVSGFGAVFSDVDLADSTEIEFFDRNGNLLTSRSVMPGTVADASLSFLGVTFNAGEEIASIRIITGTDPLAPGINDNPLGGIDNPLGGIDLVVMDDFLFAEPTAAAAIVPEPATWVLLCAGMAVLVGVRRYWRRSQDGGERPRSVGPQVA
jgi:hypothetical protein